jgi:putative hydrolase of the HAD superfamily
VEIRLVLFDLDNTLFDHEASSRTAVNAFLGHFGVRGSVELEHAWFDIENRVFDAYLAKQLSLREHRRERLRQFLPLTNLPVPESVRQLDEVFAIFLRNYENAWTAFADAAPALEGLRLAGVPVAVVTNGHLDQQLAKIQKIGLWPLVDQVFSPDRTGYAKPAAEAFLRPCDVMQVPPAQALYVGDNYRVDVQGARSAGLVSVLLKRRGPRPPGAIRSLNQLPAMLAGSAAGQPAVQLAFTYPPRTVRRSV